MTRPDDAATLVTRIRKNDPNLIRLDLTETVMPAILAQKSIFLKALPNHSYLETVHVSGRALQMQYSKEKVQQFIPIQTGEDGETDDDFDELDNEIQFQHVETGWSADEVKALFTHAIAVMPNLRELCFFKDLDTDMKPVVDETTLSLCLQANRTLQVLMLWNCCDMGVVQDFAPPVKKKQQERRRQLAEIEKNEQGSLENMIFNLLAPPDKSKEKQIGPNPDAGLRLSMALRQHISLERLTLTFPANHENMPWACLDVAVMGMAAMGCLRVLQIRCTGGRQHETLISADALSLLFCNPILDSLYLENIGLLDDHVDAMVGPLANANPEMATNQLALLDLKDNWLTDDALYTFGRILPGNTTLRSLDLSGDIRTDGAGEAFANGVAQNKVLTHVELSGTEARYRDEFDVPQDPFDSSVWMQMMQYHLRLNRARSSAMHALLGDDETSKSDSGVAPFFTGDSKDLIYDGDLLQDNREAWVISLNMVSDHLDALYYFVRTYSLHCDRSAAPVMMRQRIVQPDKRRGKAGFHQRVTTAAATTRIKPPRALSSSSTTDELQQRAAAAATTAASAAAEVATAAAKKGVQLISDMMAQWQHHQQQQQRNNTGASSVAATRF